MSKRDGSRRRGLSQDERVLWATVTRAIAPLREVPVDIEVDAEKPQPARPSKRIEPLAPANAAPPPASIPLSPLGRRMRRNVSRGKEAIDARLDLHGLTQAQAHSALLHFLRVASVRGARLVLVITGKGSRDGERGVLKRQVPQWLALPEFRVFVVGFDDAGIRHGGEGALYVRLRRTRE
jgi:DNA-nicking Smr family endonuclease